VIQRFAGPIWDTLISGDPAGLHTTESTVKGLPELIKTPHGGVLTRDAGYLVVRNTFDGETFISREIVLAKGPHPDIESDFELSRSCPRRSGSPERLAAREPSKPPGCRSSSSVTYRPPLKLPRSAP
jgi:hypothetical protein